MPEKYDYDHIPDSEHKFFLWDPEGNGMMFFKIEEERNRYAFEEAIPGYCDDCWSEEVENVCAGVITHIAGQTNVQQKPTDPEELEEEWPNKDWDYTCDYALLPIEKV